MSGRHRGLGDSVDPDRHRGCWLPITGVGMGWLRLWWVSYRGLKVEGRGMRRFGVGREGTETVIYTEMIITYLLYTINRDYWHDTVEW